MAEDYYGAGRNFNLIHFPRVKKCKGAPGGNGRTDTRRDLFGVGIERHNPKL